MNTNVHGASAFAIDDSAAVFFALLNRLGCSLILSTDDSRLVVIGARNGQPTFKSISLQGLRGIAAKGDYIAAGAANSLVVFKSVPQLASAAPDAPNTYDAVYMPRAIHFTGRCDFHDMAFFQNGIVAVNTRYSCVCAIDGRGHSFTPLWKPPFITELLPQDRCHLNGMALLNGEVRFVTLLGQSNEETGWRSNFLDPGGLLLEVPSGRVVARDLCLPHSPRIVDGKLFCLEGGRGALLQVDPKTGDRNTVLRVPGFAHGLCELQGVLFVAASKLRKRKTEESRLPIEMDGTELQSGITAVRAATGEVLGSIRIESGIHEIYDLQVIPNAAHIDVRGLEQWNELQAIDLPNASFWVAEQATRSPP